jgi:molybdate transport system substrate-binding protein
MKRLAVVVTVVTSMMLCGCRIKSSEKPDSEAKELLLYCGAGIRPPVDELVETFERLHGVKIATDYAGSEVLLSKIKLIRRGDLYMPGDEYYIEQAASKGMILSQQPVCYFVPTILVQKGNPKNIRSLRDLLQSGLKIGLGDPNACAVGRKTREIFAKNNIPWDAIQKNVAFLSLTVNELGMQIQARSLDAVIVWDAIARYYNDYGEEIPIPIENNVISTVDVGVLTFTKNRSSAEKFVEFAASEQGRAIFKKHLYRIEPPK